MCYSCMVKINIIFSYLKLFNSAKFDVFAIGDRTYRGTEICTALCLDHMLGLNVH